MVSLHQPDTLPHPAQGGLKQAVGGDLDQQGVGGDLLQPLPEEDWRHHVVDVVLGAGQLGNVRVPFLLGQGRADPTARSRSGAGDDLTPSNRYK